MTSQMKEKIDSMTYRDLLSIWRNGPKSHWIMAGDVGTYSREVMHIKGMELGEEEARRISDEVGWLLDFWKP